MQSNSKSILRILNPQGWAKPIGYSNGIEAQGKLVFVAGQVGWNALGQFESDDLVDQVRQALQNVLTVLNEAGAGPTHIARMTWYVADKKEYRARAREVGQVYRELMGRHYPAMTLIQVSDFLEDRAKVEIEATAVI